MVLLIAAGVYINQVVVPTIPPPFMPTATITRSPESFVTDAEKLISEGKLFQAVEIYKNAISLIRQMQQIMYRLPGNKFILANMMRQLIILENHYW